MTVLAVMIGAAVGAPLRYLTDLLMRAWLRSRFPWGTLVVNVAGSFVLGLVAGLSLHDDVAQLLGTGLCGALTTYSTFGYETVRLMQAGSRRLALFNVLVSIVGSLAAAYAGLALATLATS